MGRIISVKNDFDGFYNALNYPNNQAFATLSSRWFNHGVG
ncbi:hypothetical protein BTURTLESOX_1552 [bacterium endosymbiont of Bathymodiolus sp. 5 South]|jgi:hypothetical protein|nr:hypothetical protein [uncultured Gammaproteobacteria bacterium]SHN91097.1 hypothetical protein BCLUESOX_1332 [bacterium endosymbiont of Bathymodiolus sp. 5 South]CAC9646858.1 hypothetical protein [uncultured Gammaproteobacteria bacterium]SSC08223.1 hypothetical protein BTURTLESOX_1552 [bacterium endosymbiont of Bathymodiolus sp. 5 South]VVH55937.1 hypothetical protein BSPCLSOX_875 [uncultured Gammaproteobacteria bacterium]